MNEFNELEINSRHVIDVKRFCLPITVTYKCSHCGEGIERDFEQQYLSYPTTNQIMKESIYCEGCGEESFFDAVLKLSLEVSKEVRKDYAS